MKTKSRNPNAVGAKGTDSTPRRLYLVTLTRTIESAGVVIIEAPSQRKAMKEAALIAREQVGDWEPYAEEITPSSAELMQEGDQSDE